MEEPLLAPNPQRWVLLPIKYPDIWDMYEAAKSAFWNVAEIDLSKDVREWDEELNDDERRMLSYVLAFFAASDGIVNENIASQFMTEVQVPEARCFYGWQIAMENIHSEMYSTLLDVFIRDEEKKTHLKNAVQTIPCIQRKAEWAQRYMNPEYASFGERLVAFACVEGIHFSPSFQAIGFFKKRNILHGLQDSNSFIARDEGTHCKFACLLFRKYLNDKPSHDIVLDIVKEAVELEKAFVHEALQVELLGINANLMCEYVECVADMMLETLGFERHYNTSNPFPWMQFLSVDTRTNVFDRRVTEYRKAIGMGKKEFRLDEDC